MSIFKVKTHTLLLLACLVWLAAGGNILRLGVLSYPPFVNVWNVLLSILVFTIFGRFIFGPLVKKHRTRIAGYDEQKQYFFRFFDGKSFLIMAFMMGGGIWLRASGVGAGCVYCRILFRAGGGADAGRRTVWGTLCKNLCGEAAGGIIFPKSIHPKGDETHAGNC